MRNLLIAGLAAMSLIAFGACGGDEEETSTKECTSNADCGEGKICGAEGKCVDDTNVTPGPVDECTTNDDCTDATKPVCDNGTCVADSTVSEGCSTNADCTDAALPICDNGTCVAAPASNCPAGEYEIDGTCYAEGDACDANSETLYYGSCTGNTGVYCNEGMIDVLNCGDQGMICGVGDIGADCYAPCNEVDEVVSECVTSEDGEEYQLNYICETLTDGSLGGSYDSAQQCSAGCDAETNKCVKLVEDEGEACDASFIQRCDGDIAVYCDDYYGIVTTLNCGDYEGAFCDTMTGQNVATCYDAETIAEYTCNPEDADSATCDDTYVEFFGVYFSDVSSCEQLTNNGAYVLYETSNVCSNGCDADTGKCIKLVDNEGESCTTTGEDAFVESCGGESGNVVVYCSSGVVSAFNCGDYDGYSCLTIKGESYADCYSADTVCTAGDEKIDSCDASDVAEYTCVEMSDGSYHYNQSKVTECASGTRCVWSTATCESVPAAWDEYCDYQDGSTGYSDGMYCDCGCGVLDPDCADSTADACDWNLCEEYYEMSASATQNWICE